MDWRSGIIVFCLVFYADGFSKYGRTCRDIGCLNSEVCVLAEDPCSYGHASNCGTYPTCKKKSLVEGSHDTGSHSEPVQPSAPRPAPPRTPTRDFDSAPSYPPPAPPAGNPYGGNTYNGGNPPTGGNPYGGYPPASSNPYGGNTYNGGNSPYGGGSPYGGNSPNAGSNYPGGSPYGGSSSYGGNSPYGGSSNGGAGNPYGGNSPYAGSSSGGFGGTGGKGGPLDSIINSLSKYASGGGGSAAGGNPSSGAGGSGLSNIFGNILGNLSKNGGLNNLFNTRPIMENPNYSSFSSNSRSSNPQTYPSGYPTNNQQPYQNKNYGQSHATRGGATTHKPASYGWNLGVTVMLTYLIHQYIQSVIRH